MIDTTYATSRILATWQRHPSLATSNQWGIDIIHGYGHRKTSSISCFNVSSIQLANMVVSNGDSDLLHGNLMRVSLFLPSYDDVDTRIDKEKEIRGYMATWARHVNNTSYPIHHCCVLRRSHFALATCTTIGMGGSR